MPRTLDQILGELDSTYSPQIAQLRQRQGLIPGQIAEEEKGLQAKQTQAFDDILGGARRRGLGFSGIPLGEQAKYTSTEFLPALARLKQTGREQAMSLEDAILGVQERRNTLGQQLYQGDQDRAEQQRQFNEQLAAQQRQQRAASSQGGALSKIYQDWQNRQAAAQQAQRVTEARRPATEINQLVRDINAARKAGDISAFIRLTQELSKVGRK